MKGFEIEVHPISIFETEGGKKMEILFDEQTFIAD